MQCMANSQLQYVAVTVKMFIQVAKCELYSRALPQNVKTHSIILWQKRVQRSERSFSFRDSLRGLLQRDVWHKAKAILLYFFINIVTKLASKQKKQHFKTGSILIIWRVSFRDSFRGLFQRDVWHKAKATHSGVSSLPNHQHMSSYSHNMWHLSFTTLASEWAWGAEVGVNPLDVSATCFTTPYPPLTLDPL